MITDIGDILWFWDALHGLEPMVGGDPVFTRESNGFVVPNRSGMLREVDADMPRFPFVSVGGERLPALLLEHAATNLCLDNEDMDGGNWTASGVAITADDAMAPDGQEIAHKVHDDSASLEYMNQDFTVANDSLDHCVSVLVRKSEDSNNCVLEMFYRDGTTTVFYRLGLDRANGALATAGSTPTRYGALDVGDYWLVYLAAPNNSQGNTRLSLFLYPAGNTADPPTAGVGASVQGFIHPWGFQLEKRDYPTSYTGETEGSSVIRAAESMHWSGARDPQPMVIYLDMVLVSPLAVGSSARFLHIGSSAGTDPRLFVYDAGSDSIGVIYDPGTLAATSIALTSPVAGDRVQVAFSLAAGGSGRLFVSHNGGAASSAAFAAPAEGMATDWSGAEVWLNSLGATGVNAAKYRRLLMVKPGNLDSALDGTENDELIAELEEIFVNSNRELRVA